MMEGAMPDDRLRRPTRNLAASSVLLPLLLLQAAPHAFADDRTVPSPRQVIYPGDLIRNSMLSDIVVEADADDQSIIENRAALIGKVAKRTLLPGQAIPTFAVANPRAVANGAHVTLIYRDGDLTIVTSAQALEPGAIGDIIKVRNDDSGLTVTGRIGADGSVNVSGG
jgi:flagella basal body P-ring formation protein FlgA